MKREVQQVFLDFFGVPQNSPRRKQKGVYHSEIFGPEGKAVQIILLDTRYLYCLRLIGRWLWMFVSFEPD
jgi:hypothetical protein